MGWLLVGASGIEPDGKNRKEIEKYYEKTWENPTIAPVYRTTRDAV